jgi:hypothetical protein
MRAVAQRWCNQVMTAPQLHRYTGRRMEIEDVAGHDLHLDIEMRM